MIRVSTCCGEPLEVLPATRHVHDTSIRTRYSACSSCHEPNDGESIAERGMRVAEAVREACVKAIDNMDVDANPQIDTPHKMWVACSLSAQTLDLGAITGRK